MSGSVFVARRVPQPALDRLTAAGLSVEVSPHDRYLTAPELAAFAAGRAALIVQVPDRIDAALLDAAGPQLRVVATCAAGIDNFDVAAARARGVVLTNAARPLTETVADLAFGLMIAAARGFFHAEQTLRAGRWPGWAFDQFLALDVHGRTLGIVGFGRIGQALARRARGFAMRVLYATRASVPVERRHGAEPASLDGLLRESDFVSLHVPRAPETHHLIGAAQLALMKPTAVLVNTARGTVVDEAALVAALRSGRLAAAGLDVFEHEPRLAPGLVELENVVLLPHIGSATAATRTAMATTAADNVIAVLSGRPPPDRVA